MRWTLLALLLPALIGSPSSAYAQDSDEGESVCTTLAVIEQTIDAECGAFRAKAERFDELASKLRTVQRQRDELAGQLELFQDVDSDRLTLTLENQRMEDDKVFAWIAGTLLLASGAASTASLTCHLVGCSDVITYSLLTAGAGSVIAGSLILTWKF